MKKNLSLLLILILGSHAVYANSLRNFNPFASNYCTEISTNNLDDWIFQLKKERATLPNALQLNEEQTQKYYDIIHANNQILEDKLQTLYEENQKLLILKRDNAHEDALIYQQNNVENLQKNIYEIIYCENTQINKILDSTQRSKLRNIQKLSKQELNSSSHKKDYYKSNPKMREFAPNIL